MSERAGAEEEGLETSNVTGEIGFASVEGGDVVLSAVAEGFWSAGAAVGEDGRDTFDLTATVDSASAGGGGVEVCAGAGGCWDCKVSVRAVVVGDDLGT